MSSYAIMQRELVVPEIEQLNRAFRVWPSLTKLDAQTAANDAYGILLRGLDVEKASALQDALLREKIETEVVEEASLPTLPPGRVIRQIEFDEQHLALYDSMRRPAPVAWRDIVFIAAGLVTVRELNKARALQEQPHADAGRSKEETHRRMLLEIFLRDGGTRFSISADEFAFDHLGARLSEDPAMNFVLLVQDLARHAPDAGQNRGAFAACRQPPELFPYPSKPAFQEEMIWMLWRIRQLERGGAGS